jgi:hypothetical protein
MEESSEEEGGVDTDMVSDTLHSCFVIMRSCLDEGHACKGAAPLWARTCSDIVDKILVFITEFLSHCGLKSVT